MDLTRSEKEIDAKLDSYRLVSDDLADRVVAELIKSGAIRGAGADLVAAVESHAKNGGKACAEMLEQAFTVPSWVRFPDMRAGTQLGLRTPVQSALSLILGSLLETY